MPRMSTDPARYNGPERLAVEALHKMLEGNATNPELRIPVPTKNAGIALRQRIWAFCKAIEKAANPKERAAIGYPDEQYMHWAPLVKSARRYTTTLQPVPATGQAIADGPHILLFFLVTDKPEFADAMDYLAGKLAETNNDQQETQ